MSIESIRIKNILSFDDFEIDGFRDINCVLGANNVGKSNLMKCVSYFYSYLENDKKVRSPSLHSNYSSYGTISIVFNISRIISIAKRSNQNTFFKHILKVFNHSENWLVNSKEKIELTLKIHSDNKVSWQDSTKEVRSLILYIYPFFCIEPRHMNLHEWNDIWDVISSLKPFKLSNIDTKDVVEFFDNKFDEGQNKAQYRKYIDQLNSVLDTKHNSSKDKILTYLKSGLDGDKFSINDDELSIQSDGTNTFHYLRRYLKVIIEVSKKEFINPLVFVDEPEVGLHPKMSEELISDIYDSYGGNVSKPTRRSTIILNTHSPHIVKGIIRSFGENQSIYSLRKKNKITSMRKLSSNNNSESILNRFNDNEARLFFSRFILFVEGETELEVFGNRELIKKFPVLRDVDVYKCADAKNGRQVNPYEINSTTPFLFLYDADKALKYSSSYDNGKLYITPNLNSEIATIKDLSLDFLVKEEGKYNMGYNENYKNIASSLKFIRSNIGEKFRVEKKRQLSSLDHEYFIDVFNNYLKGKNAIINKTTFERVLVNDKTMNMFFKWYVLKRPNSKGAVDRALKCKAISNYVLLNYINVYIGGKTNILASHKDFVRENSQKTGKSSKFLYRLVSDKIFCKYYFSKSDGWATEYLNFCIKEIEKEATNEGKSFEKVFSFYFSELYGIVSRLRPDRYGGV